MDQNLLPTDSSSLPAGFSLKQAIIPDDLPSMMHVYNEAFHGEALYRAITDNIEDVATIVPYLIEYQAPRWAVPDIKVWKIVRDDTGEMVAWAGLQYPWSTIPEMTPDLIQALTNPAQPTSYPAGTNLEALHELFSIMFEAAEKYGFDPYHDFKRAITTVLPAYQKQGLGTYLTRHINKVVDEHPPTRANVANKTYVEMRPSSVKMFTRYGFMIVGE